MTWVRSKVRQASLLALFALAIQLVLSFGHFHMDGSADAATFIAKAAGNDQSISTAQSPSDLQHPDGLAADSCAICATIALANTLVTAAAPTLPALTTFAVAIDVATPDVVLSNLTRSAFRSRAPPQS